MKRGLFPYELPVLPTTGHDDGRSRQFRLLRRRSHGTGRGPLPRQVPADKFLRIVHPVFTVGQLVDAVVDGFARRRVKLTRIVIHDAVLGRTPDAEGIPVTSLVQADVLARISLVRDEPAPGHGSLVIGIVHILIPPEVSFSLRLSFFR